MDVVLQRKLDPMACAEGRRVGRRERDDCRIRRHPVETPEVAARVNQTADSEPCADVGGKVATQPSVSATAVTDPASNSVPLS